VVRPITLPGYLAIPGTVNFLPNSLNPFLLRPGTPPQSVRKRYGTRGTWNMEEEAKIKSNKEMKAIRSGRQPE